MEVYFRLTLFFQSYLFFHVVYPFGFSVFLFVPIFCSKLFYFPCHLVVSITSCILHLLTFRIFSRCFGKSCFVYIILSCLDMFLIFLSPVPSDLFPRFILYILLVLFSLFVQRFPCFIIFVLCNIFLIFVTSLILHPGFVLLFMFFSGTIIIILIFQSFSRPP